MCEAWFWGFVLKANNLGREKKIPQEKWAFVKLPLPLGRWKATNCNPGSVYTCNLLPSPPCLLGSGALTANVETCSLSPSRKGEITGCLTACKKKRKARFLTFHEHLTLLLAFFIESQLFLRTTLKQHSHLHFAYLYI